ncbi:MAG TPA: ABC transporter substrate-binding protein, partial [Stellaceae bacterium]|nr:ABC transporter substrate-binding protein [Stellaceae bacterium]
MGRFRALARLSFAVLAAVVVTGGAFAPTAQAQTKITVGYGIASDFLTVLTARDEGIFAKHGLEVEMTAFTNGGVTPQALVSGTVQIAFNTGPVLVLAKDGGLDLVVFAGLSRIQKINPHSALVTRAGLTVTKPADL